MQNKKKYVVYGAGETGKQVVDTLIECGQEIIAIFDKNPKSDHYQNIRIFELSEWSKKNDSSKIACVMAIHNHYIDPLPIYLNLSASGFCEVLNMVEFSKQFNFPDKYWLSSKFDYGSQTQRIQKLLPILSDNKSKIILNGVWEYWTTGKMQSCPNPSLDDEYTPKDIPRYTKNLRLIDCGASNGSTMTRLTKAGYELEAVMAFEPDPDNFQKLARKERKFNLTPLPLGVWSSEMQMRFSPNIKNPLASVLDSNGTSLIQCVSLDKVAIDFKPNIIKFDIEGAELDALHGAEDLIKKYHPNLCISLYHKPSDPLNIIDLLTSYEINYDFYIRCHEYNSYGLVLYCINTNLT